MKKTRTRKGRWKKSSPRAIGTWPTPEKPRPKKRRGKKTSAKKRVPKTKPRAIGTVPMPDSPVRKRKTNPNKVQEIQVENVENFLIAIKPNTIIRLKSGTYNISDATHVENKYIKWFDRYDGFEPVISNIHNLTIIGEEGTKILVKPIYAWVMNFNNSKNIRITNLIIGHVEAGYCAGGVLAFSASKDIEISRSVLFGSGTTGIELDSLNYFKFVDSTIKDCTYGLVNISNSTNIECENANFENTGEYDLISIYDSSRNITFSNCTLRNNWTGRFKPYLFNIGGNSKNILLEGSKIRGNRTDKFVNNIASLSMQGNTFSGNHFSDFSDEQLNRFQKKKP